MLKVENRNTVHFVCSNRAWARWLSRPENLDQRRAPNGYLMRPNLHLNEPESRFCRSLYVEKSRNDSSRRRRVRAM